MNFTDTATLAGTRTTRDGYLTAEVACARAGCQTYLGSEIGMADERPVTVYRPADVVFAKDSLATFAGKPVTMGHPAEMVTADSWKEHAVGEVGDEVARDGETVRVGIMVRDAAAIRAIADGTRQISMGYSTPVEMRNGVAPDGTKYQAVQTGPITINHLALVDAARGGSALRIGDGPDGGKDRASWGASPLATPPSSQKEDTMSDALISVVLGDKAVNVPAAQAPAIEAFKTDAAKKLSDAKTAHKAAMDAKDAEIAKKDAKIKKMEDATMSDADLDARVQARAKLIGDAAKVDKDVKVEGLSDADIRKAIVTARVGDMAGKSDAYIEARFDALAEDAAKGDPAADAIKGAASNPGNLSVSDKAYAENIADISDAWKGAPAKKEA